MCTIRVVAGAIIENGRVLAAQRGPGMAQEGHWELPGGKVEAGETDEQALQRELNEELGIQVNVGAAFGEHIHDYGDKQVHLVAHCCTLAKGTPHPREHAAIRWMGRGDLSKLDWAPADRPLIHILGGILPTDS